MIEGDRSPAGHFTPGQSLTAWELNRMGDVASKGITTHSSNTATLQGSFGTVFMEQTPVLGEPVFDYPFKVTTGRSEDGKKIEVYVRPGTVNNRMPKLDDVYLDDADRPVATISSFTSTNKKIVALKVIKDTVNFFPDKVEVILVDGEEALTNDDNNGFIQVASISGKKEGEILYVTGQWQYLYSSIVVVRAKPGTATAIWAWSSR